MKAEVRPWVGELNAKRRKRCEEIRRYRATGFVVNKDYLFALRNFYPTLYLALEANFHRAA